MTANNYLYLKTDEDGKIHINYADGVFTGCATRNSMEEYKEFCEERRNDWIHSKLGNYSPFNQRKRMNIASRWDKAKEYNDVNLEFYFNLDSKDEIFKNEVARLAKLMGIKYELTLK